MGCVERRGVHLELKNIADDLYNYKHNYIDIYYYTTLYMIELIELRNNVQDQVQSINNINQLLMDKNLLSSEYKILCIPTEELNQYITNINKLIYKRCQHNWIIDYIDIDPDKSVQIKYCELCQLNFDNGWI